jgi:hypothetical protein
MSPKPKVPQSSVLSTQSSVPAWAPTWKWHLKALAGIYLFLAVFYVAVNAFLSRLPAPYGLRDIPPELTPWLKK